MTANAKGASTSIFGTFTGSVDELIVKNKETIGPLPINSQAIEFSIDLFRMGQL